MRFVKTACALSVALATTLVSGCASKPATGPLMGLPAPPAELLKDCRSPGLPKNAKNKDLAELAVDLKASIAECNLDKRALRAWASELKE